MTIKQQGGIFGRNPTFNNLVVDGTLTVNQISEKIAAAGITIDGVTLKDGNVVLSSGKGIDFSANPGAGTSELFDDYEEGLWTPTVTPGSGSGTYTVAGNYRKISNTVVVSCSVFVSTTGTASGAMIIGGLPFAPLSFGLLFQPSSIIRESGVSGVSYRVSAAAASNNLRVSDTLDGNISWAAGAAYTFTITYPV